MTFEFKKIKNLTKYLRNELHTPLRSFNFISDVKNYDKNET